MAYFFKLMGVAGVLFALHTLAAGGIDCCTDGFSSLQEIMLATDTVPAPPMPMQGLHPALRITCDGNLTEIIYTATPGGTDNPEFFFIWRELIPGMNTYTVVTPAIFRGSETLFARINEKNALYSVRVNDSFVHAGDFIGFVSFGISTLRFLRHNEYAYRSIYNFNSIIGMVDLDNVTSSYNQYFLPLITVVIEPSSACSSSQSLPTSSITPPPIIVLPTPSIVLSPPSIVTPPPVIFPVTSSPTSSSINPTATFTLTTTSVPGNSHTVLIATVAMVSGGVAFCLLLLLLSVTVLCVTCAVRRRKKECRGPGQSSGPEYVLSDSEIADKKISSKRDGRSDEYNSSMEYNPTYGDPSTSGHIQQHNNSSSRENMYHTLHFAQKPRSELEEQDTVNHDNKYDTLQGLDHKPKYDSDSDYYSIVNTPNSANGAGVQKWGGGCGCDGTTLGLDSAKSGEDMAKIEHDYDDPDAGFNRAENCGAIIINANISYSSLNKRSHV